MENSLFYTHFSPLNAENLLLGLCNFNIFWGRMPPDTPENVDCWNSWLLYSNLLATSIFIETPAYTAVYNKDEGNLFKTIQYKPCDHKGGTYIKVGSNCTLS